MTTRSEVAPRGPRSETATISSPAVMAPVVACPEGNAQPPADAAQSAWAGRGRWTSAITP
jgi:hypothetical protein